MLESLLEAIDRQLSQGKISWGAIITAILFFNKINRNREFKLRDQRVERNQQKIMLKLGVVGEWHVDKPSWNERVAQKLLNGLQVIISHVRIITSFIPHSGIEQSTLRRKNMLTTILKANLSKKLISALVAMAIVSLNGYLNLNIPQDYVWGVMGLSLSHISLQTIIDSIKAWALSKVPTMPNVQEVVQRITADPNATHQDITKMFKESIATYNMITEDFKKNDGSKLYLDSRNFAAEIKEVTDRYTTLMAIPPIPEQKVS